MSKKNFRTPENNQSQTTNSKLFIYEKLWSKNNESQWCYRLAAPYPHVSTVHVVVGHENQQLHCLRLLM